MQQDNPYASILNTVRGVNRRMHRAAWGLGIVTSKNPLVIKYGDHDLSGKDLLVNYHLVPGHKEKTTLQNISGTLGASVDCEHGSITKIDVSSGTLESTGIFGGVLEAGDHVAMLCAEDQQTFIVLCKVVDAW